ncbi:hypothetical protein ACIPW5_02365 [Streptomyces sp. NPDC090077]|uniref:hypothetical protein n=1 Tax=Streptomyces sp. NPDC090077 TaxID=3365938 RepID=UPI003802B03A
MTGPTGHAPDGERPVERRLREALEARAEEVTVRSLRPADPPGPHLRRLSVRSLWLRRGGWALAGVSGLAAAALAGYLVLGGPDQRPVRPEPPAAPPELGPTGPSVSPRPSAPSSSPAPSSPSPSSPVPPSAPAGATTGQGIPVPVPSATPGRPSRSAVPSSAVPPGGSATPTPAGAGGLPPATQPAGR